MASEDFPTLVYGQSLSLEVQSGCPLYYRLPIKGVQSPLKFKVKCESKNSSFDFALSTFDQAPTVSKNELAFRD